MLLSCMGSIGYIMADSRLEDVLKALYAENSVNHIMCRHEYSRAVRARTLVYLSLAKKIMDNIKFTDEYRDIIDEIVTDLDRNTIFEAAETATFAIIASKFEKGVRAAGDKGPTAKLWIQYFQMVTFMKHFIKAERSGNWSLH